MVLGKTGGKPSNPLDSKVVGTFNFTDYGLVYASAAELKAMKVFFNIYIMKISQHVAKKNLYNLCIADSQSW